MAITPKTAGSVGNPNSVSSESEGSLVNPISKTAESESSLVNPISKTAESASSLVNPISKTSETAGSLVNPISKTAESAASLVNPIAKTSESAASLVNPIAKTSESAGSLVNPIAKTSIAAALIPRSVHPLVDMHFDEQKYTQCGEPVSFADLFTYSRNSSATFINRRIVCGKTEYFLDTDYVGNVENLALYSEQIENAVWIKANVTVLTNNGLDENKNRIADKIFPTTTGTLRGISQNVTATTAEHDVSFKLKADGINWVKVFDAAGINGAWFDVRRGLIGTISGTPAAKIEPLENGWFRCSITDAGAVSGKAKLELADSDNTTTVTKDGEAGVLIIGAQLTLGAKILPYVKTIASAVTKAFTETLRVEYDPETGENLGALIEGASTNLILRSEEFDRASWITGNTPVITINDIKSPDGTTSADKIAGSGLSFTLVRQQPLVSSSTKHTFSIFVHAGSLDSPAIRILDGTTIWHRTYDLASETTGAGFDGVAPDNDSITNLFNGWFLLTMTITTGGSATDLDCRFYLNGASVTTSSDFLYVWGAQLESLLFASNYIRTEGSAVSRSGDVLEVDALSNISSPESDYTIDVIFDCALINGFARIYSVNGEATRRHFITPVSGNTSFEHSNSSLMNVIRNEVTRFTGVVDSINTNLYKNRVLADFNAKGLVTGIRTTIGIGGSLTENQLFGHIKSLSIYDVALTAQEVALL